jgi:hypothetical protein
LLQLLLLSFIYSYFIYFHYQLPLKTCLLVFIVNPWSKLFINTLCSSLGLTLLFIESTTLHPLYLWVITPSPFWGRSEGWKICKTVGSCYSYPSKIQWDCYKLLSLPWRKHRYSVWSAGRMWGGIDEFDLEEIDIDIAENTRWLAAARVSCVKGFSHKAFF